MSRFRIAHLLVSSALALAPGSLRATPGEAMEHLGIAPLMGESESARRAAALEIVAAGDRALVPGIVDALFFTPKRHRVEIVSTLRALTGHDAGADYYAWVEWLGASAQFPPGPGYAAWKRDLFARIDPAYGQLFDPKTTTRIRLEEIVFGGARFDAIPALADPPHVSAREATGLRDDELVFGVALGGEARAYPHRFLSWHEMANDVVGGEPITLSY